MSGGDFWSRRKAQVEAEEASARAAEETAGREALQAELAEKPEAEVLEELGLPDPDTMKEGDDFSVFLRGAVPEALRRRALRRLWRSNPVLANLDGLNDYDEDFTQSDTPAGALKTAYKVGKGIFREVLKDDGEADTSTRGEVVPEAEQLDQSDAEPSDTPIEAIDTQEVALLQPDPIQAEPQRQRRMQIRFLD